MMSVTVIGSCWQETVNTVAAKSKAKRNLMMKIRIDRQKKVNSAVRAMILRRKEGDHFPTGKELL
jgi:hypothetical protein